MEGFLACASVSTCREPFIPQRWAGTFGQVICLPKAVATLSAQRSPAVTRAETVLQKRPCFPVLLCSPTSLRCSFGDDKLVFLVLFVKMHSNHVAFSLRYGTLNLHPGASVSEVAAAPGTQV